MWPKILSISMKKYSTSDGYKSVPWSRLMVDKILLMSPTSSLTICSRFSDFCRSLKRDLFEMVQQLDQLVILALTARFP